MTLGPAFGAPPPSDFNEPHDLHHGPAPMDPDPHAHEHDHDYGDDHDHEHDHGHDHAAASSSATESAADEQPKGLSRWFGWLRRSG
jgi:hypothetical protein